jgi:hypothetical protein
MKLIYVTKKQVSTYIENLLKQFNNNKEEFNKELDFAINELTEWGGSPNQLKFFTRVKTQLNK